MTSPFSIMIKTDLNRFVFLKGDRSTVAFLTEAFDEEPVDKVARLQAYAAGAYKVANLKPEVRNQGLSAEQLDDFFYTFAAVALSAFGTLSEFPNVDGVAIDLGADRVSVTALPATAIAAIRAAAGH